MRKVVEKLKNGKSVVLAFLGDSITQGCFEIAYSREGMLETAYRSGQGYPYKVREILSYLYPKASVNILNYGVSGDTSGMGVLRVDDMLSHRPDGAVVCFGLNDAAAGMDGIEVYREHLGNIFEKLSGIDLIFMTPNRMADYADGFIADDNIYRIVEELSRFQNNGTMDAYMECARDICAEKKVSLCDCYKVWERLKDNGVDVLYLLANKINHPTEKMHWLFAIELVRMIME